MMRGVFNYDLGEQRRGKRHQLDRERGEQNVAKDPATLQQRGDEPAETEFRTGRAQRIRIGELLFFWGGQQHRARIDRFELGSNKAMRSPSMGNKKASRWFGAAKVKGGKTLTGDETVVRLA